MKSSSPGRARRVGTDTPTRVRAPNALLLYLLPMPALVAALLGFSGNLRLAIGCSLGFCLAMVAATLMRKGLAIENEARRRKIVRRNSTVPYKFAASVVLGVAVAILAIIALQKALPLGVLLGGAAFAGSWLLYGTDPGRSLPDAPAIGVTSEEVIDILNEADRKILAIESAADRIGNLELKQRLRGIVAGVREITGIVEDDPRDLRRARKFLRVYLDGARRVTEGYAQTHTQDQGGELEENFRNVLTTIESVIGEQKQRLLENNLTELDVQIEVLQTQLEREGV